MAKKAKSLEELREEAVKATNTFIVAYFGASAKAMGKNLKAELEVPFGEKLVGRYEYKIRAYLGGISPGMKSVSPGGGDKKAKPTVIKIAFENIDDQI